MTVFQYLLRGLAHGMPQGAKGFELPTSLWSDPEQLLGARWPWEPWGMLMPTAERQAPRHEPAASGCLVPDGSWPIVAGPLRFSPGNGLAAP